MKRAVRQSKMAGSLASARASATRWPAARQLVRVAMLKATQMNQLDQFLSIGFTLGPWHASHFRAKDDIFQNRAPGKQANS